MQLNTMVDDLNHVKLGYTSAVLMKFDKLMPSLNGSSKFISNYTDYQYREKIAKSPKLKQSATKSKSKKRQFFINKTKVRDKTLALFNLQQSKKFSAFLTISFPQGFSDKSGVKVLNNVLTNIRQKSLKFNYLWVAERQKNNTIHFHMIVNRFFNVRILNNKFANAIQNELEKTKDTTIKFDKDMYNGLDIKHIRNQKSVMAYITKYIVKNDIIMNVRAWASDSIVSSLFTHISEFAGNLKLHMKSLVVDENGMPKYYQNDWCYLLFFKSVLSNQYTKILQKINQNICDNVTEIVTKIEKLPIIHKSIKPNYLFSQQELSSMLYH